MNSALNLPKLIYRTLSLKLSKNKSNPTTDYNLISTSYDEYYSRYLGKAALELLEKLPVKPDQCILDLACGTGFFTHPLAEKVGNNGKVFAVDLSSGMLECNQNNALLKKLPNIMFVESDALLFMDGIANESLDGIVCGWGICYMDHVKLLQNMERIVKPGGFIGIIENRSSSLKAVSDMFMKALVAHPNAMIKNTEIHLPKDKDYLVKTFTKRGIVTESAWNGKVTIPCKSGDEVAEYMLKSGASAGFLDALDKNLLPEVMKSFVIHIDKSMANGQSVPVNHEYCALVATKSV
jgi:ubiquinone/menaquinone biosynthesis C-methylase UbiE